MTLDVAIVFIINVIFNLEIADKNQQCAACCILLQCVIKIQRKYWGWIETNSDASRVG